MEIGLIKNNLKREWSSGRGTLNGWLSINSAFTAEIMANQGYDSVTVDMQHGALDYEGMLSMLQAVRASGVVPMVRVPWNHPPDIMKALDAGAYGVICPMINSKDEAAAFVNCLRYPPYGERIDLGKNDFYEKIGTTLIEMGFIEEDDFTSAYAEQLGYSKADNGEHCLKNRARANRRNLKHDNILHSIIL